MGNSQSTASATEPHVPSAEMLTEFACDVVFRNKPAAQRVQSAVQQNVAGTKFVYFDFHGALADVVRLVFTATTSAAADAASGSFALLERSVQLRGVLAARVVFGDDCRNF